MKKLSILLALLLFCGESVLADPLEIELNVKQGESLLKLSEQMYMQISKAILRK